VAQPKSKSGTATNAAIVIFITYLL
jgi:hypothetical protein